MAIAAHLDETAQPAGKPRNPRRKLRLEALGAMASGAAANVLIHNISSTGLLLESRVSLTTGETIVIDLPHAGTTGAKVIWKSGNLFGCEFDAPISAAALSAAQLRSLTDQEDTGRETDSAPQQEVLSTDESFGIRLQRLRKERGCSLSQLAAELGVSKPTVWAWEQGRSRPVDSRIEALATALGVSESDLLSGHDNPELHDLLAKSREKIAATIGTSADKVRILIEL